MGCLCKMSLTLDVRERGEGAIPMSHHVSRAVPYHDVINTCPYPLVDVLWSRLQAYPLSGGWKPCDVDFVCSLYNCLPNAVQS